MNPSDIFNENVTNKLEYIWEQRDRRVDGYFLMDSVLPTVCLCACYATFSLIIGPWYMKNKQPFRIKKLITAYNFIMIFVNAYIHYQCWNLGWGTKDVQLCEPIDKSNSPQAINIVNHVYAYYLTKYIDWVDTIFFILRKKFTHVSGLHVYHHSMTPLNIWPAVRFVPGGHVTFAGLLNTLVHTVMYTYYTISSMGPKWKKHLWWKKYVTILQIIQFIVGMIHISIPIFYDCGFPTIFLLYMYPQGFLFIYMFVKFYRENYLKPKHVQTNKTD